MSEKLKIYIARDGEPNGRKNGKLFLYSVKPYLREDDFWCSSFIHFIKLPIEQYPEILNGTYKCFELVEV